MHRETSLSAINLAILVSKPLLFLVLSLVKTVFSKMAVNLTIILSIIKCKNKHDLMVKNWLAMSAKCYYNKKKQ
jgi:hypothetical protein